MGTFNDLVDTVKAAEEWCGAGLALANTLPMDPDLFYALNPPVCPSIDWVNMLSHTNAAKFKTVILASVQDFADALPAGDDKTRLDALANETADLGAYTTWFTDGRVDKRSTRRLIGAITKFLVDPAAAFAAYHAAAALQVAKSGADSTSQLVAGKALVITYRSRCTLSEFKNGLD